MPAPGKAFATWDAPLFSVDDLIGQTPSPVVDDLVNDYLFGSALWPAPIILDYTWLVQPVAWRPTPPVNSVTVSRTGGATAVAVNSDSVDAYGTFNPGSIALESSLDADTAALGTYLTGYQPGFLQRPPQLTFDLLERTTTEQWLILSVTEGAKVTLANTPATWPGECQSVMVDGIAHEIGLDVRRVIFTCNPLVGQSAGRIGPWFAADRSTADSADMSPY